ncbi:MAG: Rne/Rng family ribonuclease [Christensenellales bacterium]|jgi:ribonuclease G
MATIRKILIEGGQTTRVAVIENDRLAEIYMDRPSQRRLVGSIYVGRVANVLPGMSACFVDIGEERNAYLQLDEEQVSGRQNKLRVKQGQQLLVQVIKEPVGAKGARLTRRITLPGRTLVYVPDMDHVSLSRRIVDEGERDRLRELVNGIRPEGRGFVVRTVAAGLSEATLSAEASYLVSQWERLESQSHTVIAPKMLLRDDDILLKTVRDLVNDQVAAIVVDQQQAYDQVRHLVGEMVPDLLERVQRYQLDQPIFDYYSVEGQLDKALMRRAWLKSGGYLVIDQTEALTVIDVNTGKNVGKQNLQETIVNTNLEAVEEIAWQLRLRDIGGIIIIDLIDMQRPEDQERVLFALKEALKADRTRTNVADITALGLVEMTRKKERATLSAQLERECPLCRGTGHVPTDAALVEKLHRDLLRQSRGLEQPFLVEVNAQLLDTLLEHPCTCQVPVYARSSRRVGMGRYQITPLVQDPPADAVRWCAGVE